MIDIKKTYSPKFFARRHRLEWRIPLVAKPIYELFKPNSIIDYGCGNGDILSWFYEMRCIVIGIEGTDNCLEYIKKIPRTNILIHDLREKIPPHIVRQLKNCDVALCLEVAEHIDEEYSDVFIDNLTLHKTIIFTAAGPGQDGLGHVNCQEREYWIDKFLQRGYVRDDRVESILLSAWKSYSNVKGIKAYYQNLMIFRRKN